MIKILFPLLQDYNVLMKKQSAIEQLICNKLLEMIETKPFQKIKVTEFVEFCGISRSSFYLYFDSIYAAVQKIEDDFIDGLTNEEDMSGNDLKSSRKTAVNPATLKKAEYISNNIKVIKALTGPNGDPSFIARVSNRTWRIFKKRYENDTFHTETEKKEICEYMCGGQVNLFHWYVNHQEETSVYEFAIMLDRITSTVLTMVEK